MDEFKDLLKTIEHLMVIIKEKDERIEELENELLECNISKEM